MVFMLPLQSVSTVTNRLPFQIMKTVTDESRVIDGARLAAPFVAADFLDGVAFGVVAVGLGVGAVQATVISATAFSGSAQFASLTVVGDHGSLLAILAAVTALNARYLVYGASVAGALSRNPFRRVAEAQMLTDASWALSLRGGRPNRAILIGAGLVSFLTWTTGTAAGAAFGRLLDDTSALGLDAALPAFFLCLMLERLRSRGDAAAAVAGAALALALAPFTPAGVPLLAVLAAALIVRPA
jgi:branched chain amino acid efflux pump